MARETQADRNRRARSQNTANRGRTQSQRESSNRGSSTIDDYNYGRRTEDTNQRTQNTRNSNNTQTGRTKESGRSGGRKGKSANPNRTFVDRTLPSDPRYQENSDAIADKLGETKLQQFAREQGDRNREQTDKFPANEPPPADKDFSRDAGFEGEGSDTQDVLDATQAKYDALLKGSGRRGSAARAMLAEGLDNQYQDAISSNAYQRLVQDSTVIADKNVQLELDALGVDWKAFATGTTTTEGKKDGRTGESKNVSSSDAFEDMDVEAFSKYLEDQANPFAVLRGEQGAQDTEVTFAAETVQANLGENTNNALPDGSTPIQPIPSLLSGIEEPGRQQTTVKRV
jgi:hypothetical protein